MGKRLGLLDRILGVTANNARIGEKRKLVVKLLTTGNCVDQYSMTYTSRLGFSNEQSSPQSTQESHFWYPQNPKILSTEF